MATSGTVGAEQRRLALVSRLQRDGALQIEEAATELGVSAMTVRRDLDDLGAEGLLRRVRGGAVAITGPRPFSERRTVRSRAKQLIAEKALALIPRSGAIALDASTTAGTIGASIGERSGLTVATNSYENFRTMRGMPGVEPILVGGALEAATDSFVGLVACQAAASMFYQRFFTSASALDAALGTSEVSLPESQIKKAFAGVSRELILCIDSSKLGDRSLALCFTLADFAVMITELDPGDARLDEYRDLVELR
ncbi:DeoR/GlpR family DNA-binding transcription regulator [Microterricola pindariensis]|uniref:DeoR family transcriptional regulator n=1 Tax=Microterricola pindariensis TaxID=478010 RepID=A0ABX5AW74_9MICO|nr:DeoR/GlpR family DNA-binding transcription regulator [Microterricola pindariensis]PPL18911.1 DeoR family transcriptional regulator [Microterricola pindariensis]